MKISKVLVALGGALVVAAAGAYLYADRHSAIAAITPPSPDSFDVALVERGEKLAGIGNCAVCHTAEGSPPMAGGLGLPTPFGTIHSTNITPDAETGIGSWSKEAFVRAMRKGVDREGRHLYPAFPYDFYTGMTDEDLEAIYAYLMSQEPVRSQAPANDVGFPLNQRILMAGWNLLFLDEGPKAQDSSKGDVWNRGQYLTESVAHCGACHSPRNMLGAAARSGDDAYSGGEAEGWFAPALNASNHAPIRWNAETLANYLIDGWERDHGIAAGPMLPIANDLYHQPEEEAVAIAVYVADLMGNASGADAAAAGSARERAEGLEFGAEGAPALATEPLLARGAEVFADQCAVCHRAGTYTVPLALTGSVNAPDARNFVHTVMHGIQPAPAGSANRFMPAKGLQIGNEDLVALTAFVRGRFGPGDVWENVEETVRTTREGAK